MEEINYHIIKYHNHSLVQWRYTTALVVISHAHATFYIFYFFAPCLQRSVPIRQMTNVSRGINKPAQMTQRHLRELRNRTHYNDQLIKNLKAPCVSCSQKEFFYGSVRKELYVYWRRYLFRYIVSRMPLRTLHEIINNKSVHLKLERICKIKLYMEHSTFNIICGSSANEDFVRFTYIWS